MSYHVYHSEAIVLESRPYGEGDRLLHLYTRELGLVVAHVKSIREVRSRLRYTLQQFAHADIDLIRGKRGWKLISARPISSHATLLSNKLKRVILAQHAQLIRRLIQGEFAQEELFDDILRAIEFLQQRSSEMELRAGELLFVVRLLANLGYWKASDEFTQLLWNDAWQNEIGISMLHTRRANVLSFVNSALQATQL